eukprot:378679-Rhodomonas_salina.1
MLPWEILQSCATKDISTGAVLQLASIFLPLDSYRNPGTLVPGYPDTLRSQATNCSSAVPPTKPSATQ